VKLSVESGKETVELECFDDRLSRKIAKEILEGRVYPRTDLVPHARVVMDVGANIGAATLYFSLLYPAAEIFAFEPHPAAYRLLEANTRTLQRVHRHAFGLFSVDDEVPLYLGATGTATSSVFQNSRTLDASERVKLRSVSEWLKENSIETVDVLKIDTEGCEIPILRDMRHSLPSVKLIYLEYHSEADRKEVDRLLGDTHVLLRAKAVMGIGNVTYLSNGVLAAVMVERGLGTTSSGRSPR
jgi:FkbM family methyltransferase